MSKNSLRVLALTKYGAEAASTRQRLLQYLPHLSAANVEVEWHPILGDEYVRNIAEGVRPARSAIAAGYIRRMTHLAGARRYDLLWVYAELFPYLPAMFERLVFAPGRPIIYDFDDAFFHQYDSHPDPKVRRLLARKLEPLIAGAEMCCCGNAYLQAYAAGLNDRTVVLPTVVDTAVYHPLGERPDRRLTIGWIGTPSTWAYVRPILPMLVQLATELDVRVRIVGAGAAARQDVPSIVESVDWSAATEVQEVQGFDIGIMPLPEEQWARGKSGYKLIQYMACGLPVLASPVGVNAEIVVEGETGFLPRTLDEWRQALTMLIGDAAMRRRLGTNGRLRAEAHYSLEVCAPRMVDLFRTVGGREAAS